jgi:hypothetical protein
MSGIVGSNFNDRVSGLVGSLGTDGQHFLSSGVGKQMFFETVAIPEAYDDEPLKSDLTALAIREATNESSAAFNLPGSFIETFTDDTNLGTQTTGDRASGYWTATSSTATLIQSANSVAGGRTSVGGTMLYADEDGTATLGTDLKIYFSCNGDAGSPTWTETDTYTAITPVYASGIKQVRLGKMTCTEGTDVRYKAVWANQAGGSKETRLHAIGINY